MSTEFKQRFNPESGDVLDAILAHSRDCIGLLNLDGAFECLSESAKAALGVADSGDVIGRQWREFWPKAMREALDTAIAIAKQGSSERFDGYTETAAGTRRWWEVVISPLRGTGGEISHLLAISTDVTARKAVSPDDRIRREQERSAGFSGDVSREMRHKLKNQLAVVGAVAKLLARHTPTARELATKLEDKLFALARAQDLLTLHRDHPILARAALDEVLAASGAGDRIEILAMPEVRLPDESLQTLSLILDELRTNALKYGALREEGGRIELSGRLEGPILVLRWRELCRSRVEPTTEENGGFQLIARLGSAGSRQAVIDWHGEGIIAEFAIRATLATGESE